MNMTQNFNRITLPPEVMLEIEEALNYPRFFGIPVGVTINDALIIANNSGKWTWSWLSRVSYSLRLRYRYECFLQRSIGFKDLSLCVGQIVFTICSDRADLKAFILPLVENYGSDKSIVIGPFASMQAQLPKQTPFVLWDEFSKIDTKAWRDEFNLCAPTWRHRLDQVMEKHSVPQYVADFLLSHLQVQTRRIMAADQFLDVINPKAIVTEADRSARPSCLVLAARHRGIPAVTMVHGALTPYPSYGYTPILSNYVCCWGKLHKQSFMEHGVNEEQLIVTGCQSLSRTLDAKKDSACLKVGLPLDKPVVLLATSPIKLENRKNYAYVFCAAMSKLPEMSAIVRLHPSENIAEYQELIDKFPSVKFLTNIAMSRDESLAVADIVVIHESSFGNEALLKGKLVVILDVLATPLRIGKKYIEIAGCPSAQSSDELVTVIRKILASFDWRKELHAKAEQYTLQYCDSFGQDAVNNVCRVIDHAIEIHVHK
jgi:hypothetical protein